MAKQHSSSMALDGANEGTLNLLQLDAVALLKKKKPGEEAQDEAAAEGDASLTVAAADSVFASDATHVEVAQAGGGGTGGGGGGIAGLGTGTLIAIGAGVVGVTALAVAASDDDGGDNDNDDGGGDPVPTVVTSVSPAGPTNINEGQTVSFTINTTGIEPGGTVNYTLTGPGITDSDVNVARSGTLTVGAGGVAVLTVEALTDLEAEGTEALTLTVSSGTSTVTSVVNIANAVPPPPPQPTPGTVDTVMASSANRTEGESVTFTIDTTGIPAGGTVSYTISGDGITDSDVNVPRSGTLLVDGSGTATLVVQILDDGVVDSTVSQLETLTFTANVGTSSQSTNVVITDATNQELGGFKLTTDADNVVGTAGNDIVRGQIVDSGFAGILVPTLQSVDVINDASATDADVLIAGLIPSIGGFGGFNNFTQPTVNGIEQFDLTSVGGGEGGSNVFDFSLVTGLNTLRVLGSSGGFDGQQVGASGVTAAVIMGNRDGFVDLNDASSLTSLTVTNNGNNATLDDVGTFVDGAPLLATVTVSNQNSDVDFFGSTVTELTLNFTNFGTKIGTTQFTGFVETDATASSVIINTSGSNVDISGGEDGGSFASVKVDATGANTLSIDRFVGNTSLLTVTGTGSLIIPDTFGVITKLDATANSGGVTATANNTAVVTGGVQILGGSGNDVFNATVGADATVNGGAGNDSLTVDAGTKVSVIGGDGNDALTVIATDKATVDSGTGDDTVSVTATDTAIITTGDGNDGLTIGALGNGGTVATGLGNDTVNVAALGDTNAISLGEGDDFFKITALPTGVANTLEAGPGADTVILSNFIGGFSSVGGGANTDIINLTAGFNAAGASKTSSFETLDFSGSGVFTYDLGLAQTDATKFSRVQADEALNSDITGAVTLSNTGTAQTVFYLSDGAGDDDFDANSLTLTLAAALVKSTTDAATIDVTIRDSDNVTGIAEDVNFLGVTATGYETLNFAANVVTADPTLAPGETYDVTFGPVSDATATRINVTGNADVVNLNAANVLTLLARFDATGSSSDVNADLSSSTKTVRYDGSSGIDTVTFSGQGDNIFGGASNDVFTLGAVSKDTVIYRGDAGSAQTSVTVDPVTNMIDLTVDTNFERIIGFEGGPGSDQIQLEGFGFAGTTAAQAVQVTVGTSIDAQITNFFTVAGGGDRGAVFANGVGGDDYVFVDVNKDGDFTANTDLVIQLMGTTNVGADDIIFLG